MAIDYANELNPAQLEAVRTLDGPVLVIAGAGSGKTRTVVYRLAHLVEQGVYPDNILLLTFTRKAAQEMLTRAGDLLGQRLTGMSGGTFHSFAYQILRRYSLFTGYENGLTIMDRSDATHLIAEAKEQLYIGKGDRSFPKKDTVIQLISKSRNKEIDLGTLISSESFHLIPYTEDLVKLAGRYTELKKKHGLLDYDDLLFELERMLRDEKEVREQVRARYSHLMVDEYQDTNKVQARIVKLLAGEDGNVMAVGDDAQSIYAFRGADVSNILNFPQEFPGTKVVRLEQNYRSTQPILDLSNSILENAQRKFDKHLFTERKDDNKPEIVRTMSDTSQARIVVDRVLELRKKYSLHEVAVLFRAGYQSYGLEVQLNKLGMPFQKFGGLKFTEAAHIKDALSYMRLIANATDLPSWLRVLGQIKGVGPKTAKGIFEAIVDGNDAVLAKRRQRFPELEEVLGFLEHQRSVRPKPAPALEAIIGFYSPVLMREYPDDYPRRQQGLEQMVTIAGQYDDIEQFLADISLENPGEENEGLKENALVLSTIHSAKGLEWKAVIIIDLIEERFPGKKAMQRPEDLEEERRLMYVACTRARDHLSLFVPESIYLRHLERSDPARPSPFILEIPADKYDELREGFGGVSPVKRPVFQAESRASNLPPIEPSPARAKKPSELGYCRHKIYGRGKIIEHIPPEKYRVNFPGFGLKVIVGRFLEME